MSWKILRYTVVTVLFFCLWGGCDRKKPLLDQKRFTNLLIDMHATDGVLSVNRGYTLELEKKNYTYYNSVLKKYGITKAEFDSCLYFYSSQPQLFTKIYDAVIDSLSRRVTIEERALQLLKVNDSVNYYTGPDTLLIDSAPFVYEYVVDSLQPGNYKFHAVIRFDTVDAGKNNRIVSWFISADNEDTLKMRDIRVVADTLPHQYQWTQYADSAYNRLVIRFLEADNLSKLRSRRAKVYDITLLKPYIPEKTELRLKKGLPRRRKENKQVQQDSVIRKEGQVLRMPVKKIVKQ